MNELKVGEKVTAIYKTGKYIGEVTDIRPQHYLVKVLAVAKHPMQGDLHNPKDADVAFFHERRALAYREQTNVPKQMVKPFTEDIPEYIDSLKAAVDKLKSELETDSSAWASKSLECMKILEKDYFKQL
ncbi:kinase-associated lipoprotein B [Bacillus sp. 31A1R]|uniref:Kinase-associated lipoprotein B n=1 Tax=Robertmurraya mangrovi TaxID=3098077 RepID=A0ABU5IY30_9BACI|nr:kinase-associated lipoprotein B [Bacillus sp. 31A1R]MDZ5472070.1 kinase-associated lipoprotein B [Bacillus sp. 31A1R]